jgi:hypothetical protein
LLSAPPTTRWASTSPPPSPTFHRKQAEIESEAALDGMYEMRTNLAIDALDAASNLSA